MARIGRTGFLVLAVLFHAVYLWSIFDIYFVSPIVHGMRSHGPPATSTPPAKRLVLVVGDGLRADKAFQSFPNPSVENPTGEDLIPRPLAPFLRSRVLKHGTFGVSHTRMPTESRPGHVALIAGLYEDVSAVTTGWKLNPVNFDSVFNRSRHTWSWGSPDILPMFSHGAVPGRVDADHYDAEFEDYSKDATHLDTWVFDRVKALFADAKKNETLNAELRQDKLVFFLHLLGLDTTGHSYRPYSKEYLHNIKVVDEGVQEIYNLLEEFYGDNETAYVFTADHGMHDLGSHGDGHPDNTRTPLIVWGAGCAKPKTVPIGMTAPGHADNFSFDWGLQHVYRHDVQQADVAALMTHLAGLDYPVNSEGKLPLSYLDAALEEKAHAALTNTRGVLEMYSVKEAQKMSTELRYKPYQKFAGINNTISERIEAVERMVADKKFEQSIKASQALLQDGLQGLRYLQTYDWLFLRILCSLGFLGWITYGFTAVLDVHVLQGELPTTRSTTSILAFSSILVILYASFIISDSPATYYAYAIFPVIFWEEVFSRRQTLVAGLQKLFRSQKQSGPALTIQSVIFVGVLQALVQSYFHRRIFSILYVVGSYWPVLYGIDFVEANIRLIVPYFLGCLSLSVFTLLSAIKVESSLQVTLGGILMLAVGMSYLYIQPRLVSSRTTGSLSEANFSSGRIIMGAQIGVLALTILVTRSSISSLQAKKGLPLGNQVVGWLCLVGSLILPFVHRLAPNNRYHHRLMVIFLAFAPSFVILSISYEGLFYVAFCATLASWMQLEQAVFRHVSVSESSSIPHENGSAVESPPSVTTSRASTITDMTTTQATNTDLIPNADQLLTRKTRSLTPADLRTALFTLFLLQSAFFSTGNIASISSFSLDAVYRLIPIFDPFSQGALLMYKLLVPFAVLSAALGVLNRMLDLQSSAIFMCVMAVGDVLVLNFFWMVKDEGSWLDIGTTISHFVIGSLLSVFVAALEGGSEIMVGGVEVDDVVLDDGRSSPTKREEQNGHVKKNERHVID